MGKPWEKWENYGKKVGKHGKKDGKTMGESLAKP